MKKILIFNFYKGILLRGIPIYTDNLVLALKKDGCEVKQFICPKFIAKLPRAIIDIMFVFSEQILVPIIGILGGYDKVIYPYNSTSILSALTKKSLIIIHDFIPNRKIKSAKSISSLYIVISQRIHAWLKRDVAFVSSTTYRIARNVTWLKKCDHYLFPNAFYLFESTFNTLRSIEPESDNYVVLISGNGSNKQFETTMGLWSSLPNQSNARLKVVGLGAHKIWASKIVDKFHQTNVDILPILSDKELVQIIKNSSLMWAHSTHEGFGRPVIEGRICGLNVIATNIPAFREHKDDNVFLYNTNSFEKIYTSALLAPCKEEYEIKYHVVLENEVERWLAKEK
ncbi:glycosyltransferase [Ewingella sp. CoE-038-23]|uniref:glycosyltransferase n=1 Tax=Ewingella docleensis TaxID=3118588 RepID=UPI0033659D69